MFQWTKRQQIESEKRKAGEWVRNMKEAARIEAELEAQRQLRDRENAVMR